MENANAQCKIPGYPRQGASEVMSASPQMAHPSSFLSVSLARSMVSRLPRHVSHFTYYVPRLTFYVLRFTFLLSLATISAPAANPGVKNILVIGCDGFGSLAFTPSNTPVLHQLMQGGAYTLRARGVMPTSSSPNWASMIMGAG